MTDYLFVFGYVSPTEYSVNLLDGTDFESSQAIWVSADSEEAAMEAGCQFAVAFVRELFVAEGLADPPCWSDGNFARWIENNPEERFSGCDLTGLKRIVAK